MGKSAAERKAAQRARQAAGGLVKLEVWLPKALHERVKKYVERLLKGKKS
jgi:CO dehydrogenase/acetyl-CoA synthase beta subunit